VRLPEYGPPWAWSPDGKRIAAARDGTAVHVLSPEDGKPLHSLAAPLKNISYLDWAPDGETIRVVSGEAGERSLLTWHVEAGRETVVKLEKPQSSNLTLSPSGKLIVVGRSSTTFLERGDTGKWIALERAVRGAVGCSFAADDSEFGVLCKTGEYLTLSGETGAILRRVRPHLGDLFDADWAPGPDVAAATVSLPTPDLYVWRARTGEPLGAAVLFPEGPLVISPDGHYRCPPEAEKHLVYVVETEKGLETLTPEKFAKRFDHRNDPDRAWILSPPAEANPR
jgi:WD40 repeat protein